MNVEDSLFEAVGNFSITDYSVRRFGIPNFRPITFGNKEYLVSDSPFVKFSSRDWPMFWVTSSSYFCSESHNQGLFFHFFHDLGLSIVEIADILKISPNAFSESDLEDICYNQSWDEITTPYDSDLLEYREGDYYIPENFVLPDNSPYISSKGKKVDNVWHAARLIDEIELADKDTPSPKDPILF